MKIKNVKIFCIIITIFLILSTISSSVLAIDEYIDKDKHEYICDECSHENSESYSGNDFGFSIYYENGKSYKQYYDGEVKIIFAADEFSEYKEDVLFIFINDIKETVQEYNENLNPLISALCPPHIEAYGWADTRNAHSYEVCFRYVVQYYICIYCYQVLREFALNPNIYCEFGKLGQSMPHY